MRPRSAVGGVSLIEVVVAASLSSLLLVLVLGLFAPALRAWSTGQQAAEGQQQLLMVARKLGGDIGQSVPRTLTFTPEREFAFQALHAFRDSAAEEGSDMKIVYACPEGELWRRVEPSSAEEALVPLRILPGVQRQKLASGVVLFELRLESPWSCSVRLHYKRSERQYSLITAYSSRYAPLQPSRVRSENGTYPGQWQTLYLAPVAPRP